MTRSRSSPRRSPRSGRSTSASSARIDWNAYALAQIESSRSNFHAYLDDPFVDDPRIHHVRYRDFVADPVAAIAGFYELAGSAFTPKAETAMRDYLGDATAVTGTAASHTRPTSCPIDVATLHR